jgi:hypothetical protein
MLSDDGAILGIDGIDGMHGAQALCAGQAGGRCPEFPDALLPGITRAHRTRAGPEKTGRRS